MILFRLFIGFCIVHNPVRVLIQGTVNYRIWSLHRHTKVIDVLVIRFSISNTYVAGNLIDRQRRAKCRFTGFIPAFGVLQDVI